MPSACRLLPPAGPDPQLSAAIALAARRARQLRSAVSSCCRKLRTPTCWRALLRQMKRICDITGKKANNANTVTFSNTKNARLQHVNLQKKNFFSPELNRNVRLKVATSTMRTITKLGLDETAKKYGADLSKF